MTCRSDVITRTQDCGEGGTYHITLYNPVMNAFAPPLPLPSHIVPQFRLSGFYASSGEYATFATILFDLTCSSRKPGTPANAPSPLTAMATNTNSFVAPSAFCTRSPHLRFVLWRTNAKEMQHRLTNRAARGEAGRVGSMVCKTSGTSLV